MNRKQTTFIMSGETQVQLMKQIKLLEDKDFTIRGIEYNPWSHTIKFLLEGDSFPILAEAQVPDQLT